jgi:hypothetical protein
MYGTKLFLVLVVLPSSVYFWSISAYPFLLSFSQEFQSQFGGGNSTQQNLLRIHIPTGSACLFLGIFQLFLGLSHKGGAMLHRAMGWTYTSAGLISASTSVGLVSFPP